MVRVRDACRLVTTTYYAIKHPVLVYVNFIFLTVVWCYVVVSQFSTPTSTSTSHVLGKADKTYLSHVRV